MNPNEALNQNLFELICPGPRYSSVEQDVAPFPKHELMLRTVAKASQDLIPPPFLMRMQ